jgi:hypothetical protein
MGSDCTYLQVQQGQVAQQIRVRFRKLRAAFLSPDLRLEFLHRILPVSGRLCALICLLFQRLG